MLPDIFSSAFSPASFPWFLFTRFLFTGSSSYRAPKVNLPQSNPTCTVSATFRPAAIRAKNSRTDCLKIPKFHSHSHCHSVLFVPEQIVRSLGIKPLFQIGARLFRVAKTPTQRSGYPGTGRDGNDTKTETARKRQTTFRPIRRRGTKRIPSPPCTYPKEPYGY